MNFPWRGVAWFGRILARSSAFVLLGPLSFSVPALAQGSLGELVLLETSDSAVLVTETRSVAWGPSDTPPLLYFSLGFSTDEAPQPGEFLDSLSVTLQTDNGDLTFLLLTIDAFGLVVAPPTPSLDPLNPNDVVSTPIEFPSVEPVLANQFAFRFTAFLPDALAGRDASLFFDLFNNQNSLQSLGWFSSEIWIPEPSVATLLAVGIGLSCVMRRLTK